MGEPVQKPNVDLSAQPEHFEFMRSWVIEVEKLLNDKSLKPAPIRLQHGLENVFEGFELMKAGKVTGQKLVYSL